MIQILQIIAGAVISIFFVIYLEKKKLPLLRCRIEHPPIDLQYTPRHPAMRHKALRIIVSNKPLNSMLRWCLPRSAALNCKAIITFHHLDGQNVFGRSMNGRWVSTPQPIPLRGKVGDQELILIDEMRFNKVSRVDIYSDDETALDIAARFDDDQEAYGWSNDSYFSNPLWRAPQWELPQGRYLVQIRIISSNTEYIGLYRLVNDVSIDDFRLEAAQQSDQVV